MEPGDRHGVWTIEPRGFPGFVVVYLLMELMNPVNFAGALQRRACGGSRTERLHVAPPGNW